MTKEPSGRTIVLLSLSLTLISVLLVVRPLSADGPFLVGIYQNEPLVFTDQEGRPSGFYVDLLEAVAAEEGWDLEYVECHFPDCLALLERGDLDLMTAIAYSEERDERFDFNRETVLANWAQMYTRKGGPQFIPDLAGRTVAVVREDIYYAGFRTLVEDFDISCQFIEVDDYGPVLERVAAGEADAGLVSRLYGLRYEGEYAVVRSPILCCPSQLRFAAPEGRNAALLGAIDRHVAAWKGDPGSIYYQALDRWFGRAVARPTPRERVPGWIQAVVLAVGVVAVLVIIFNLLLRAQVRARTRELREAEARYRGLFERVPIGLYSTTPDGKIEEANPALAELLGFPDAESMRSVSVEDLYVDRRDRQRELARVDLEGKVQGYDLQLRRADGTPIWVRDHSRAVRDEQGRVVWYEGALEDISERKAAERELERSEALFRSLAEAALVGVYLIQDGRFRYVNPALAAMFGYEPQEVIDRLGPLDLTALEDRERVAENIRKRVEGEVDRIHYSFRGLRKDGTTFDCEVMGARVEYEGRPAVLGTLLDISERKAAEERRAARARRQAAAARIGMVALSERDLDVFLAEVVSVVATTLEVELCKVLELLPGGERLLLRAGVGWKEGVVGRAVVPADGQSQAGYTLLSREPVVVEDLRRETRFKVPSLLEEHGAVSGVSVLIGTPERPWGVLGVHSTRPRRFERGEVDLVQTVANVVAQFIARTRAEAAVREQARRLEALRQIGLELAAELDLEALLRSIVERAVALVGGNFGGMYLYRPERDVLEWAVAVGRLPTLLGATLRRGEGLSGKVWETGRPMVVEDYRRWEGRAAIFEGYPYAAVVAAPIRWGEEFLGVIDVGSDEPGVFSAADAELLELFAVQAAVAIHNARQVAALKEERERLALLHRLGLRLSASLDVHTVAQQALDDVCSLVGALRGVVLVWDSDVERLRLVAVSGYDAESVASLAERIQLPLGEGSLAGWVAANRRSAVVADVTADDRWLQISGLDDWVRSVLSVPLISREELVGVMSVYSEREGFFREDHLQLVESAAATVAAAIANARLHAELRAHAEELEQRVEERTAELRQERERIQAVLEAAGEGVFVTDVRGRIQYMNPAAERMTGFGRTELRGRRLWEVLAADEEEVERLRPMGQRLRSGEGWQGETRLRRKDGTVFDARIVITPIAGEDGPSGYVAVVADVTPFRELDRMKSRFISNISHEFRTPLATAKLYIELARRQPDRRVEHLDAADAELDHLTALLEDILEVARVDAGRVLLERRVASLGLLVGPAVDRYRILAEEKGLQLEYRPGEPDPVVEVDPERMGRVVDNLLSNAIRYTLAGGEVVVSTGTGRAEGRSWATITVSDTGIGIPESELLHIFDRFFRGDEPRRMQIPGTGLGLSIVKEIVEMHGGFITVESEEGRGSTFTVWLPMMAASEA